MTFFKKINKYCYSFNEIDNPEFEIQFFQVKAVLKRKSSLIENFFNKDRFFLISYKELEESIISDLLRKKTFLFVDRIYLNNFCSYIINYIFEKNILSEVNFEINKKTISLLTNSKTLITDDHIIYYLLSDLLLSHQTSAYFNNLTDDLGNTFFVNKFSKENPINCFNNKIKKLDQKSINKSFEKPMRKSSLIYNLSINGNDNKIFFLNSRPNTKKYSNKIQKYNYNLFINSIEKTLLDITVRPSYLKDWKELIKIYRNSINKININKFIEVFKEANYIYPYHQSIGFLLESTGHSLDTYEYFYSLPKKNDFFIFYNSDLSKMDYNKKWKIYHPKHSLFLESLILNKKSNIN